MSEHKFTPGPWFPFTGKAFHGWWSVQDKNGEELGSGDGGFEEHDARLMAAAPDLLEALQEVMDCWLYGAAQPDKQKAISLAQQAIAKALGSQ